MGIYSLPGLLAVVILVLLGLERVWPASASQRGEWLNNGVALGLTVLSQTVFVSLITVGETKLINWMGGGLFDLRALPWAFGAGIYVLAIDGGEYLFHRAQHAVPWLWAMHSMHHSDRAMNVLTTQRHFWLEPVIKSVSIWLAVALAFRVNSAILAAYPVISLCNLLFHSNIRLGFGPLSWLLNSPQYHRLHHSREPEHHNANFAALFPIFDVLTGSYRIPAWADSPVTGLQEAVKGPLDVFVWPIRKQFEAKSEARTARRRLLR